MEQKGINVTIENQIALLTIDNPPVNALSWQILDDLGREFDQFSRSNDVKVIIITGAGTRSFVAGADIRALAHLEGGSMASRMAAHGQDVFNKVESMRKPVIAAINGYCLGGGLELAMACDIRIASERATFGQPEINLGIIPGFGGTQRLPRIIGKARALEMLLTGDSLTAQVAFELGLVNRVVPDAEVLNVAREIAAKIVAKGQVATRLILEAVDEGMKTTLVEGLSIEARNFGEVIETQDAQEGMRAFLEKRQPQFKDR